MNVAYTAQSKIPEANYYVASFENLVENTCEVVRDVLAFTSIKSSEEIINTCASQLRPELVHIDRWRQVLSDDEADLIDNCCGELYGLWKQCETRSNLFEIKA